MNAAAAAALLITVVSAILLTSPAPATAAIGTIGQSDDVAPKKFSLWPYKHVHISNELGYNDSIVVHCKGERFLGKKEDLGVHYVGDGWEYTWRFKQASLGVTKYSCYVAPVGDGMPVHSYFDAYVSRDSSFIEYKNNVYWAVKRDAIYMRNVTAGASRDIWKHVWVPGQVNSGSIV